MKGRHRPLDGSITKKLGELDCGDPVTLEAFFITRTQRRADTSVSTPAANNIITGERDISGQETRTITPILDNNKLKWANVPKQPIPELQDISLWIGHQLNHKRMPKEFKDVPPNGKLITSIKGHPEGLLAIPNADGSPRIIVPRSQILALVLQTHEDLHHQSHVKVLYILKPLFYWPAMTKDVEDICTACQTCLTASVRRRHLKAKFDPNAPLHQLCYHDKIMASTSTAFIMEKSWLS